MSRVVNARAAQASGGAAAGMTPSRKNVNAIGTAIAIGTSE
jgi:hypothetical protein